ncbi:hypothetical protein E3N88_42286 [Mikania micrantha]|uniref:Cytochrome P450 n=1 Tax=Mikania micrantha TaxID=192012 RepID=A0A5N6LI93_9ASTR|nr:hypothetical protein E3N88_42286 [Mikania micrantha]
MEVMMGAVVVVLLVLVAYGWQFFNWVWLRPKAMEKSLREQGLTGNRYRFFFGDLKEMVQMAKEAKLKPIKLTDSIVPRVIPFNYSSAKTYCCNIFFTWLGPRPIVHVTDPPTIRKILANYNQFQKLRGNPLTKLLARGLADVEGDQWVKHRKIINPAFHVEKLKHMLPAFHISCSEMIRKWEGITKGRFLPTKRNRRMMEIDQEVKSSIKKIINKRLTTKENGESSKEDLLGILLDSNDKEIKLQGYTTFGLSIDDVIEECKLFYFGGQETTTTLLVWTMILLGQHTNWQDRARDEVSKVFGDRKPDIDGLSHLKIINIILLEVLRLYSPVVALERIIHEETKIGDLILPSGSQLMLHLMMLHHDANIWGDDVNEFNPGRFAEGVSNATKVQASYFPFGGGPRICVAQAFAMLEAKLALVMILSRFSFKLSPSYSHAPHIILGLQPHFLILHKRTYPCPNSKFGLPMNIQLPFQQPHPRITDGLEKIQQPFHVSNGGIKECEQFSGLTDAYDGDDEKMLCRRHF